MKNASTALGVSVLIHSAVFGGALVFSRLYFRQTPYRHAVHIDLIHMFPSGKHRLACKWHRAIYIATPRPVSIGVTDPPAMNQNSRMMKHINMAPAIYGANWQNAAPLAAAKAHLEAPQAFLIGESKPEYPFISRRFMEEGEVLLELQIGPDGRPFSAKVVKSSGHNRLDDAALEFAMRAGFRISGAVTEPIAKRLAIVFELNS